MWVCLCMGIIIFLLIDENGTVTTRTKPFKEMDSNNAEMALAASIQGWQ